MLLLILKTLYWRLCNVQAFFDTARVQATEQGLYFYEQDVLMSSYLFNGDITVNISLSYKKAGFGIVIADNVPEQSKHVYLLRLGINTFQATERHLLQQENYTATSNVFELSDSVNLVFKMQGPKTQIFLVNNSTTESLVSLGTHVMSRELSSYYLGFYSAEGNTINDVTFLQGVPDFWRCSVANTHGGRISFWPESFMFENCVNDAYLEQKGILLPKGTFWFDYDTEPVNDIYDIEGFVYRENAETLSVDPTDPFYESTIANYDERNFEDINKSFIHNQGSFTLQQPETVIVSFKGRNGKVSNITIKDKEDGAFVVTQDQPKVIESSYVEVDLTNVKQVSWKGIVYNIPSDKNKFEEFPYGLIVTKLTKVPLEAFTLQLNRQYSFLIDVGTLLTLSAMETLSAKSCGSTKLLLTENDNNSIKIFYNISADITDLIITTKDDIDINVTLQGTYRAVVPAYVKGPIIVTDMNDVSFDLSGSYREVVESDNVFIDLFSQNSLELKLSYHTATLVQRLEIFGIPKGAVIDRSKTDIEEFASSYVALKDIIISVKNDIVNVPDAVRNDYEFIAVRYQRSDKFYYRFTVQERELFSGTENILRLSSPVNASGQGISVYGLNAGSFYPDYFLRVADADMISSVDLCTDQGSYVLLSSALYDINTNDNIITMDSTLANVYEYYIVDYAKRNSYAINKSENGDNYIVDIVTDETSVKVNYELSDTGISDPVIRTDIKPDTNKFIILKRGASFED